MIHVISVGKQHEPWVLPGITRYEKRLKRPYDVQWQLLAHSPDSGDKARQSESEAILAKLQPSDYVVLLDETGRQLTSPKLAELCERQFTNSRNLVFVIGGAYGVNDSLKQRADTVWSLSDLVFPHQLVRLMLTEQIYRAQEIARGGQYHHA